jgi:ATP-dependent RNA helicase RhlE
MSQTTQSFQTLGLDTRLLKAVETQGYTSPTLVQFRAIPLILDGNDVIGGAQTGTGKTAAFVLPLLQRLAKPGGRGSAPRVLILTPTRELAAQVHQSVVDYGANMQLHSTVIFGGVGIGPQIQTLRRGIDILVATPGRLLDHVSQGTLDLSRIETLVLDEADRMLDMGFINDIRKIIKLLPTKRQNLLFSATYTDDVRKLANSILSNPVSVEVTPRNTAAETVTHVVHPVEKARKSELITQLIKEHNWFRILVFTRTKHGADRLSKHLAKNGIPSAAIHGNKSQNARTRALREFKAGNVQTLVATDIAARGLDIDDLPHVINYELPNIPEDYVHRIGRTGRAGASGLASSLVSADEKSYLEGIEKLLKRRIDVQTINGFSMERDAGPPPHILQAQRMRERSMQRRGSQTRKGNSQRSSRTH